MAYIERALRIVELRTGKPPALRSLPCHRIDQDRSRILQCTARRYRRTRCAPQRHKCIVSTFAWKRTQRVELDSQYQSCALECHLALQVQLCRLASATARPTPAGHAGSANVPKHARAKQDQMGSNDADPELLGVGRFSIHECRSLEETANTLHRFRRQTEPSQARTFLLHADCDRILRPPPKP